MCSGNFFLVQELKKTSNGMLNNFVTALFVISQAGRMKEATSVYITKKSPLGYVKERSVQICIVLKCSV